MTVCPRHSDLIALMMVPGFGPATIKALIDEVADPEAVFSLSGRDITAITGLRVPDTGILKGIRTEPEFTDEIGYIEKEDIKCLSILDDDYPSRLREIHTPPVMLFCKGDIVPRDGTAVAMVGSRRCTLYGIRMAESISNGLAFSGLTVVSGMAKGIDNAAHAAALRAGGRTIAVLGSGFRNLYPPGSAGMADKIARSGAVITEFLSGTGPDRYNFPRRNRIISGISRAVIVVEAALRSGALITAGHALEQGRDVMAVPGPGDSAASKGTNSLIREGAGLVTSVRDVLEELGDGPVSLPEKKIFLRDVPEEEKEILDILSESGTVHADRIAELTGYVPGRLCVMLLRMELKGLVRSLPGRNYDACRPVTAGRKVTC